jgi:adenosylhomocysteinase
VVCATGNLALRAEDFAALRNGAYLASVTSSDDELELAPLSGLYRRTQVAPHVTRYDITGHYFYLLADGNAVNFVHGASAGAFIYLVQAEILAAIGLATTPDHEPGFHDVPQQARRFIAETWLERCARTGQPEAQPSGSGSSTIPRISWLLPYS